MTRDDILDFFTTLPLFSNTDPTLLKNALYSDHAHFLQLAPGECVPQHFTEMLGVVLSGKLHILSADTEHPVLLRIAAKGDVFGAASLFLETPTPVSRLVACPRCALFFLSRDAVRDLLGADPAFLDAYLRFLAGRVHFLNGKIRSFTAGNAERRLALWLAEHPEGVPFPAGSLTALAQALDIGRASLYRALDKMEAEALITRDGREITVLCTEKLLNLYQQ